MFGLGAPELVIIAVVILALFGYKKLPDAARAVGRSMRIFKAETRGLREDSVEAKAEAETVRGPLGSPTTPPPSHWQAPQQAAQPQQADRAEER